MKNTIALLSGILFGIGLTVSQMVNPQKVINFLNVFGQWDPSLILVMLGALICFGVGYQLWVKPRPKPILSKQFYLPTKIKLDKPLVIGAMVFGFGWGLAGLCPGPALANITAGETKIFGFIFMMVIGIKCADLLVRKPKQH